jgi:predicted transcriptional regulator
LQIVRSLCTVGASLRNQLETNDRLLNAENKKKDGDKSKVASLTKKSKQLNKNIAAIEEHLTDLFEQ